VHILANFDHDDRGPGVLAERQHPCPRYLGVLQDLVNDLDAKRVAFLLARLANGSFDVLREEVGRFDSQPCDGLGDLVSIETEADPLRANRLAYNVLQGAGSRSSKTEFVACPSCGRTLFNLQATTQKIREATGHLKGVRIAVMGCIVNGPGEMADADFGYVGGAPGKINLYVGKTPIKFNIPEGEAVERLVDLIREHGKWVEPESRATVVAA